MFLCFLVLFLPSQSISFSYCIIFSGHLSIFLPLSNPNFLNSTLISSEGEFRVWWIMVEAWIQCLHIFFSKNKKIVTQIESHTTHVFRIARRKNSMKFKFSLLEKYIPNYKNTAVCWEFCITHRWNSSTKYQKIQQYIRIIIHASKVMLKILQVRLQKYVNCELPDV